jgi:hypothetical protein
VEVVAAVENYQTHPWAAAAEEALTLALDNYHPHPEAMEVVAAARAVEVVGEDGDGDDDCCCCCCFRTLPVTVEAAAVDPPGRVVAAVAAIDRYDYSAGRHGWV